MEEYSLKKKRQPNNRDVRKKVTAEQLNEGDGDENKRAEKFAFCVRQSEIRERSRVETSTTATRTRPSKRPQRGREQSPETFAMTTACSV
ncbi:hypothetical protein HN51_014302 [Arachis hypogaea]